jgi:hypothetical protein
MELPARRRIVAALIGVLSGLAACNVVLGIDEQGARPVPDDAASDAKDEAEGGARPALERCTRDVDCVAPNACYTPHCDTVLGACTYALCEAKGRTCAKGVCDPKTFACSDPLPYGFLSTSYQVKGATSGCGPNPGACVAAAFPFVFIGTRDDVMAVRGDDLTGTASSAVPITGLTTKPQHVIASGRRVWVLGALQGQAPPYQLPISSIDVPSDPTVATISARSAMVSYPFPSFAAFPAPNGGLFLTYNDPTQGFPTALLSEPLGDGARLGSSADAGAADAGAADASVSGSVVTMHRAPTAPVGSTVVAASGPRLVLYRYPSTFNLLAGAGTAAAATLADVALNPPIFALGPQSFTQGPDGAVVIAAPVAADPVGDCNCQSHARLQFVFPNAVAMATDVNQILDPEVWVNPQVAFGACHQCTGTYEARQVLPTWIDRRTVLTAAPATGAAAMRNVTALRALARDPLEANPKRRAQTKATDMPKGELGIDRIALTSSNGIGYLLLADGQGNNMTLSIVDPRCDASSP